MKRLYLYGPPASGKSFTARRLSQRFGLEFVDLDEEIVRRAGKPIPEIFAQQGEAAFRELESAALMSVSAPIIALGGGTLLRESNRAFAERNGVVVVLDADESTIAERIAAAHGTRPLGNKAKERAAHYASFPHHVGPDAEIILPCRLEGKVVPPYSKSHLHRILVAVFLAGGDASRYAKESDECEDIIATRRVIEALSAARVRGESAAELDVGESGSTLRFFSPIAAALGIKASFKCAGRLGSRPRIDYQDLKSGVHELPGDVSSQFATGLLFALPLLKGDSEIRFTSPLQSRGYVDMTIDVLARFGIVVECVEGGYRVRGGQRYRIPDEVTVERDWSAAAFWLAADAVGHDIAVDGLNPASCQPDRVIGDQLDALRQSRPVSLALTPDNYPALAVAAKLMDSKSEFRDTDRLRLKESDRLAAMESVFSSAVDVDPVGDHRIAMAAAIHATKAEGPTVIHNAQCVRKSYPRFFDDFHSLIAGGER